MDKRNFTELRIKAFWELELRFDLLKNSELGANITSYLLACGAVNAYRTVGLITPDEANDWEFKLQNEFFREKNQ